MFGRSHCDRQYPADAITLTDALEISWSEAELLDLISRHRQIAMNVIRIIGKRLKEAQERVRELSTQRAERRVAHTVLRLARQAGQSTINGQLFGFVPAAIAGFILTAIPNWTGRPPV